MNINYKVLIAKHSDTFSCIRLRMPRHQLNIFIFAHFIACSIFVAPWNIKHLFTYYNSQLLLFTKWWKFSTLHNHTIITLITHWNREKNLTYKIHNPSSIKTWNKLPWPMLFSTENDADRAEAKQPASKIDITTTWLIFNAEFIDKQIYTVF